MSGVVVCLSVGMAGELCCWCVARILGRPAGRQRVPAAALAAWQKVQVLLISL